jgi:hypothetical protein
VEYSAETDAIITKAGAIPGASCPGERSEQLEQGRATEQSDRIAEKSRENDLPRADFAAKSASDLRRA